MNRYTSANSLRHDLKSIFYLNKLVITFLIDGKMINEGWTLWVFLLCFIASCMKYFVNAVSFERVREGCG